MKNYLTSLIIACTLLLAGCSDDKEERFSLAGGIWKVTTLNVEAKGSQMDAYITETLKRYITYNFTDYSRTIFYGEGPIMKFTYGYEDPNCDDEFGCEELREGVYGFDGKNLELIVHEDWSVYNALFELVSNDKDHITLTGDLRDAMLKRYEDYGEEVADLKSVEVVITAVRE